MEHIPWKETMVVLKALSKKNFQTGIPKIINGKNFILELCKHTQNGST